VAGQWHIMWSSSPITVVPVARQCGHTRSLVCPGMSECIVKLGGYNVNSMLCPDPKEF